MHVTKQVGIHMFYFVYKYIIRKLLIIIWFAGLLETFYKV